MATRAIMEFKRGDAVSHTFKLPIADYVVGSSLFFTAKPAVDNDLTDAAAVIDREFTDSDVTLDATYATYDCAFPAADTTSITFTGGEKFKKYLGEFQFKAPAADPVSFPPNDDYIDVIVYADIRRATT